LVLILRSVAFAVAFYLNTTAFVVIGAPFLLGPRRWAMTALRLHARVSLWLLRVICRTGIEVRGLEKLPTPPFLVAAKHQSAWDTFALLPLFRDPALVMKAELGDIPVYGWFAHKFEHILIKRKRAAGALRDMIVDAKARVAEDREVLIFPEGTRSAPGSAPDYKPGLVALYEALKVPCVPLALNSGLYWPRRQFIRYPGTIVVEILDVIGPGMGRAAFKAEIEQRIETASRRLIEEAASSNPGLPIPPIETGTSTRQNKERTFKEQ
jgi:1-acyl-sn-glycerol-3-phosphate acyltransferase